MSELGNACSHGVPWDQDCPQCNLISAQELVSHWGEAVDAARKVITEAAVRRLTERQKEKFEL